MFPVVAKLMTSGALMMNGLQSLRFDKLLDQDTGGASWPCSACFRVHLLFLLRYRLDTLSDHLHR